MKSKSFLVLMVFLVTVPLVAFGCSATKTVTVYSAPPLNTTETIPFPTTFVTPTTTGNYLPTVAAPIEHNMAQALSSVQGLCLVCHGPGAPLQEPLPPTWDGTKFAYPNYNGIYTVIQGTVQDHTAYPVDGCFTTIGCHTVSYG